jgi:hypothetical protein
MSRLVTSTALALALAVGTAQAQQEVQPEMTPTMITQDTAATSGDLFVPLLFVIFALLAVHGGSSGGAAPVVPEIG